MEKDSYVKENGNRGAFACQGHVFTQFGLSKRELLAAMAMQGFASNKGWAESMRTENDWDNYKERLVKGAVEFADALLAELERTNKQENEDD
jgi:hypothetical protein